MKLNKTNKGIESPDRNGLYNPAAAAELRRLKRLVLEELGMFKLVEWLAKKWKGKKA